MYKKAGGRCCTGGAEDRLLLYLSSYSLTSKPTIRAKHSYSYSY